MTRQQARQMATIRAAILSGNPTAALAGIEDFARQAARHGLDDATRAEIHPQMAQLRRLAEASLQGARQAAEEVRAIIRAARSLQTYDEIGRRTATTVVASAPQRF
ncbi:hypothetical protein Q4511_02905 [Paracoccus sp. 1_MG-2023]|uniref:hypothetical protein n=2 Tax=unclassified Paracoccus (in: a-proteobacteria) TaxID=2688777 RepID=UPI0026E2F5F1|nr:hypothetical protein [Paracoccus sp. 1_MG-2023]MDO6667860.1 hypothetical protein [Paracoccus sp. 1_MG-2023]